jgi:hypothetical protein
MMRLVFSISLSFEGSAMETPIPEPDWSFLQAGAKVQWANQHIAYLNSIVEGFVKGHPQPVFFEQDAQGSIHIKANVAQPMPASIPLMAGDIVHQLRCALDYCWMGLNRSLGDGSEKRTTPFAKDERGLIRTIKNTAVYKSIEGVEDFVVNKLATYEGGNRTLYLVTQLDNWDKHNLLVVTVGITEINKLHAINKLTNGGVRMKNCQVGHSNPFTIAIVTPEGEHDFDCYADMAFTIFVRHVENLSAPMDEPLMPFLMAALKETDKAVNLFRATFGNGTASSEFSDQV